MFKETDGTRTVFQWDGDKTLSDQIIENTDEDKPDIKNAREFIFYERTFEPLALIETDKTVYFYNNDLIGLPHELYTGYGRILWRAEYDAFGKIIDNPIRVINNPIRLQGQYYDEEIGLSYNQCRYYDSSNCAFISKDPIDLSGGVNLYNYSPNIWAWIDPFGLSCVHGNSLKSTKPNHVYVIVDKKTGKMMKPGISGQTLNKNGTSPRANVQLSQLNKGNPGRYDAIIVEKNVSRKRAVEIEQIITDKHAARNSGAMPSSIHRRPKPQVQSRNEFSNLYGFEHNTSLGGRY